MLQSVDVLNVLYTLTSNQTKIFFKKLEYCFLVESTKMKMYHFDTKLSYQKPMLRQMVSTK